MRAEEFDDCLKCWQNRLENERAWRVPVMQIIANDFNLDLKKPNAAREYEHMPIEQLSPEITAKEARIAVIEIKNLLGKN